MRSSSSWTTCRRVSPQHASGSGKQEDNDITTSSRLIEQRLNMIPVLWTGVPGSAVLEPWNRCLQPEEILGGVKLRPGSKPQAKERGEISTVHIGSELYTAAIDGSGGRMGQQARGCTGKTVAEVPGPSRIQVQHTYAGTEANPAESKHAGAQRCCFLLESRQLKQ